ncbi:hypothetical protein, partial [Klebsiella pneumoniae]|uniref:hypothetical protein n=1 Tax=Klebsiella pneumoniae TaxID=573 RepID=UPI001BE0A206
WKPSKCDQCGIFCHGATNCPLTIKKVWVPKVSNSTQGPVGAGFCGAGGTSSSASDKGGQFTVVVKKSRKSVGPSVDNVVNVVNVDNV